MSLSEKILGQKINDTLMRHTFYGQFVAGNSLEEINERQCFMFEDRSFWWQKTINLAAKISVTNISLLKLTIY